MPKRLQEPTKPTTENLKQLSERWLTYFKKRGISSQTLSRNGVQMIGRQGNAGPAAFPYFRDKEIVNIKYRTMEKQFHQVQDALGPVPPFCTFKCVLSRCSLLWDCW